MLFSSSSCGVTACARGQTGTRHRAGPGGRSLAVQGCGVRGGARKLRQAGMGWEWAARWGQGLRGLGRQEALLCGMWRYSSPCSMGTCDS